MRPRQKDRAGESIPLQPVELRRERCRCGFRRTGTEERIVRLGEPLADGYDLLIGLPGAEHDLGMALPQRPMVIDGGKRKALGRKMAQSIEGGRRRQSAGRDIGEEPLELVARHATRATGSRYSKKIASASATDST